MKKLLKLLVIGLFTAGVCTTFTGCLQLISSLLGNVSNNKYYEKEKEQTYTVKDTGTVYFVNFCGFLYCVTALPEVKAQSVQ